jgi:hypothetical protein
MLQSTVYIGKAVYVFYSLFSNIRLQSTVYIGKGDIQVHKLPYGP